MNSVCLFFELLQVAIGSRELLSVTPSDEQWNEIFALCQKQALGALAFRGVLKLCTSHPDDNGLGASLGIDELLYLKWLGLVAKCAQRSKEMTKECAELVELLRHDGFHCCILKGQGNLVYYPDDLKDYRLAGDIDVLFRSMEVDSTGSADMYAIDLPIRYCLDRARLMGKEMPKVTYHHTELTWKMDSTGSPTVEVEGHYRATFLCSPVRNIRLQRWLDENMPFGVCDAKIDDSVFPIPTVSYNTIYQILHIYKHLFEEGIGLRQLMDYYFVLRALHIEQEGFSPALPNREGVKPDHWQSMGQWAEGMGVTVMSNEEIMHTLGRFGMKKFAGAVMYVIAIVFDSEVKSEKLKVKSAPTCEDTAMISLEGWRERWPWMICEPDEKEGKFLLNEIMMAGNFGQYDDRIARSSKCFMGLKVSDSISHAIEKTKHNLRLLKHYPEEVLWEPFFRVYHWIWRRFGLWRY